ncbi:MAG TPA: extracellular solute-binding protein [Clostridiales bacterium]|nr:extracellular solute-binding protein [Clostridiales bacterium]
MKGLKKTFYIFVTVIIIIGLCLLSSCNINKAGTIKEETSQGLGVDAKDGILPITFTAFIDRPVSAWNGWGNDPVTKEVTRRTGVSVTVSSATTTDSTKLSAMIATDNLPDFIITRGKSPIQNVLSEQGYLLALNQLMDQYAPEMRKIVPKDLIGLYSNSEGNFYFYPDRFYDVDRVLSVEGYAGAGSTNIRINLTLYEKIGKPPMATLDEYKEALKLIKTLLPDVQFPIYDGNIVMPHHNQNLAQFLNRIYGGTDTKSIANDDTVHLNFKDESYLKAIQYINNLYREGLFNKENFTIQSEQFKEVINNDKLFTHWGPGWPIDSVRGTTDNPYWPIDPPQVPGIQLKIKSQAYSIGGGVCTSISKSCIDPARAIKYLEFMISDEGQLLFGWGIENKDYTYEENYPRYTQSASDLMSADWDKYNREVGAYNYNSAWILNGLTDVWASYWYAKTADKFIMEPGRIMKKYAVNERLNDLTVLPLGAVDEILIETQIFELWKNSLPSMYLAETEAQCMTAYNDFINKAEKLGLNKLEQAYTEAYRNVKEKLSK